MNTSATSPDAEQFKFIDRVFLDPRPEHIGLQVTEYKDLMLDWPAYNWEYFGHDKYGRYAVCSRTGIRRGLTMGEFYGDGTVD